jgi:hypothetical protein
LENTLIHIVCQPIPIRIAERAAISGQGASSLARAGIHIIRFPITIGIWCRTALGKAPTAFIGASIQIIHETIAIGIDSRRGTASGIHNSLNRPLTLVDVIRHPIPVSVR